MIFGLNRKYPFTNLGPWDVLVDAPFFLACPGVRVFLFPDLSN